MPTAEAKEVEVENEVIVVAENKLVEIAAQKKFDDLIMIMKELVKQKLAQQELEIKNITILDFELLPQQGFEINYSLN